MNDNITLYENKLTAEQFCDLQESVGFGRPNIEQIRKAIANSQYCISAEMDGIVIGMGRLVGDGARIFYIQDLFINPKYQKIGIGTEIVSKLIQYIKGESIFDTNIMVV